MATALITGAAGFFGDLLKKDLLSEGFRVVGIDLEADTYQHPAYEATRGDIRDVQLIDKLCRETRFDAVIHCAAILAHAVKDRDFLWTSNVDGTRNVAEAAKKHRIPRVIFTSSNCLWAKNFGRPVTEEDWPEPMEIYGRSKWEGEKILARHADDFIAITFRCPTIMDEGRLGLLAILFEFIDEGRKVWVVGGGDNVYQFIYAADLIAACKLAMRHRESAVFNIGSDNVRSFHDVYSYVIARAGTKSTVASLPKRPTLLAMKLAYHLKMSPLGPYQYKMIAEDFVFATGKIKAALNWRPTLTNEQMLHRAYEYYHRNAAAIKNIKSGPAHRQAADMGVIRLLKWLS